MGFPGEGDGDRLGLGEGVVLQCHGEAVGDGVVGAAFDGEVEVGLEPSPAVLAA
ncbi:MAG: hypothetical protein V3U39_08135 [Acidimicrobiia bacterium]